MKEKDNRDWPSHLQWPPPYEDEPMVIKIFLSVGLIAGIVGLIIWAIAIWFVPLNPAG